MTSNFPRTTYARMGDRLPHPGPAAFGPYIDKRARLADRLIVALCAIGALLFALGVLP